MKFLNLAARVSRAFSMSSSQQMRTVQRVKDGQIRDVVTQLDMELHEVSGQFVAERLPGCRLLSEEGEQEGLTAGELRKGDWLIVDPLDGSSNYSLGMPNYGYMAAYLCNGCVEGAVVVLPEHDQYIILEGGQSLYAKPLPITAAGDHGTVYYAYPPKQDAHALKARCALMHMIDTESAGMYRYGSACAGLYQLLCGNHIAFIGHEIRLWDAIAFMPVLASAEIVVKYAIRGVGITLVASTKASFLENAERILQERQGIVLQKFCPNSRKIDAK
jgi:myo-inositol-1(or 4)-monophosphatase